MHRLKWSDLQYVLAVAETGSVAAAARALRVHHATVLRRIGAFEERCGMRVFERLPRGYHLTPESQHMLATLRDVDQRVEDLHRAIAAQSRSIAGPLHITTTDALCGAIVMPRIDRLQAMYPGIRVELSASNDVANLSKLEADLTIRPALSLAPDLDGIRVCGLSIRAYASPDYLAIGSMRNPANHNWLGATEPVARAPSADWMARNVPKHSLVFQANSFLTLQAAAEAGRGVAFLPCFLGDASQRLVRVDDVPATFMTSLWIAAHSDRTGSSIIQVARTFLVGELRQSSDQLEGLLRGSPQSRIVPREVV